MSGSGEVNITVADNGAAAIQVPAATTQLVIGCSKLPAGGAVAFQIVATQTPATLYSSQGPGPLVEAGALSCLQGGTVLSMNVPTTTTGTASAPTLNQGAGATNGTSALTTTLDGTQGAFDDFYFDIQVVTGGTIGTTGIVLQVSFDAGRNYGSPIQLGTANTLVLTNTGVTLNFGAGTLVTGNFITFSTVGPRWQISDMLKALTTFQASPYGIVGVGSIHIVGGGSAAGYGASPTASGVSAADIAALSDVIISSGIGTGGLDLLAQNYIFDRAFMTARDAAAATLWTGASAESKLTWVNNLSLISSVATGIHSPRDCVNAGYYNTPTAFPNPMAGSPSYRRPLAWSLAAREVVIPPQRHAGRVKDGALTTIVVNPASDPTDGFIYYDTRLDTSLDGFRFSTARTRVGKGAAFYIAQPNLMSVPGSVFTIYPLGAVMDVACDIVHQVGEDEINDDIRLNANGTIFATDANTIESALNTALQTQMVAANMISGFNVVVNRTTNILATNQVVITVTIEARGYIFSESVTITYLTPAQAA